MVKNKNKTDLIVGVLIGAVIMLMGFFAFYPQQMNYQATLTGMHSTNNMMGNMMMRGMMGTDNLMSGAHTDANADGKCDMCGMSIEMCKGMKLGER